MEQTRSIEGRSPLVFDCFDTRAPRPTPTRSRTLQLERVKLPLRNIARTDCSDFCYGRLVCRVRFVRELRSVLTS